MKGLLFTYFLTYGGAALSLFNPFYGLLVYVCFAIVRPEAMWFWSVPQGNYSRIVAAGLLIGWALHGFGTWKFGRSRAVVFSLIAFWAWTLVAVGLAPNREVALPYLETLTKIVLPFVVGATVIDSVPKLMQLAWCIALSESYVAWEKNLSYFNEPSDAVYSGFATLDNNGLAVTMVCGAALSLFLAMETRNWYAKCLAFVGALMMLHTVLFSFSRGGMLGLVVSAFAGFWIIPKRPQHYLAFGLAVTLGLYLAGAEVRTRFMTIFAEEEDRDKSAESRIELWKACAHVMWDEPWGIGPGQFTEISQQLGFAKKKAGHTTWLQIGAEQGVPGLLCILAFYFLCVVRLWPLAKEATPDDPILCSLARVVIASIPGFFISAQFVSLSLIEIPYYIVLVGVGVLRLSTEDVLVECAPGIPFDTLHSEDQQPWDFQKPVVTR